MGEKTVGWEILLSAVRCSLLGVIVGLVGFVGPRFSLSVNLHCGLWFTRCTGGACCFSFHVFFFGLL